MTDAGWERYSELFARLAAAHRDNGTLEILLDDLDAECEAAEDAGDAQAREAFGWLRERTWVKLDEEKPASLVYAERRIVERHLGRWRPFTIRTRLPRARRRGAGRPGPRRRRGSTARSGQDPGSDLDEPPPSGRRGSRHHQPSNRRRR